MWNVSTPHTQHCMCHHVNEVSLSVSLYMDGGLTIPYSYRLRYVTHKNFIQLLCFDSGAILSQGEILQFHVTENVVGYMMVKSEPGKIKRGEVPLLFDSEKIK